jgi:plasmid stabilization system protein ParE
MKLAWSNRAVSDLGRIHQLARRHNPRASARIAERIETAAIQLPRFPNLGRLDSLSGTRELALRGLSCFIVYRAFDDAIQILRVFHASPDFPWRRQ